MTNEIFYAIFGYRIGNFFFGQLKYFNEGAPANVEFDYQKVIDEEDRTGRLIGFYHTHPNMGNWYSNTDYSTMESWIDYTGKELLCLIDGKNGIATYECYNEQEKFIMDKYDTGTKLGNFIFGKL